MLGKEQGYVYQTDWQLKPKHTHAFFFSKSGWSKVQYINYINHLRKYKQKKAKGEQYHLL